MLRFVRMGSGTSRNVSKLQELYLRKNEVVCSMKVSVSGVNLG